MTAARPGWVTLNEVSGSSLPVSVSGHIANFLLFICLWDQTHFAAQHNVRLLQKAMQKMLTTCFLVTVIVSEPVPSTSFKPTDSWLPTQESKETRQESANTTYQWKAKIYLATGENCW